MISLDPLAPGWVVYTSSVDDHAKVGLYRLEVGCSPGTGKLKTAGGIEGLMQESIKRAFAYMMSQKVRIGVGQQVDKTDFHVEAIDLLSSHDLEGSSHPDRNAQFEHTHRKVRRFALADYRRLGREQRLTSQALETRIATVCR
jgi:predicted ATP-dependent Lon-type protease